MRIMHFNRLQIYRQNIGIKLFIIIKILQGINMCFFLIIVFIMFCKKQFLQKCLKNFESLHSKKYDAEQSGLNLRKEKGDLKLKKIVFYSRIYIYFKKSLEINKRSTNRLNSKIIISMCAFFGYHFQSMILQNFYVLSSFISLIPSSLYKFLSFSNRFSNKLNREVNFSK